MPRATFRPLPATSPGVRCPHNRAANAASHPPRQGACPGLHRSCLVHPAARGTRKAAPASASKQSSLPRVLRLRLQQAMKPLLPPELQLARWSATICPTDQPASRCDHSEHQTGPHRWASQPSPANVPSSVSIGAQPRPEIRDCLSPAGIQASPAAGTTGGWRTLSSLGRLDARVCGCVGQRQDDCRCGHQLSVPPPESRFRDKPQRPER